MRPGVSADEGIPGVVPDVIGQSSFGAAYRRPVMLLIHPVADCSDEEVKRLSESALARFAILNKPDGHAARFAKNLPVQSGAELPASHHLCA